MSTKTDLLKLLDDNYGQFVSGQKIADTLGVSRAAVNKAADSLRKSGYKIQSRTRMGYRLHSKVDLLTEEAISAYVERPCKIETFDTIGSTNSYAKGLEITDRPIAVVADKQSAGRGRLGRTFESPEGTGVYLSVAFKPDFDLDKALFITMAAAVATCRAIEKVAGVSPKIKWVNDLYYKDKKICGILTEAISNFETGKIDGIIIGIGINCFPNSFPPELAAIAGPISDEKDSFSRSQLAGEIINNILAMTEDFQTKHFMAEYKRRCFILGKNITVHTLGSNETIKAKALDIDENGGLVVEYMEGRQMREIDTLTSGEVSVRNDELHSF